MRVKKKLLNGTYLRADRYKKVLKIFSKYNCNKILDIGCGDGSFSILLKEACNAMEVYGIELSGKEVELARKKGVKCYQLDIDKEDFPFKDNYFDAIFAGEIIEHLYDPDHLLDEVYRVLGEGIFVLTTPNLACLENRISLLLGFQPYATTVSSRYRVGHIFGDSILPPEESIQRRHVSVFTLRALKKLLKIHGFNIIDIKGARVEIPNYYQLPSFLRKLEKYWIWHHLFPSLSPGIIVVCKKRFLRF